MYKIRGKILDSKTETIESKKGDTFEKMLITIEELDSGFHNQQQFEIFGKESINVIENSEKLSQGQYVNINFYIKSREFKGKFYNTLMAKEVRIEDASTRMSEESTPF